MHPDTKRNLVEALRGESLAVVRLYVYADRAEEDGNSAAAARLRHLADSCLDRAAALLRALGWVGGLRDNVLGLVVGDSPVHALPYARYGHDAHQVGDDTVADLFRRLTREETEAGLVLLDVLHQPRPTTHRETPRGSLQFAPS